MYVEFCGPFREVGGGEWGFATPAESGPIVDLQHCTEAWCVEAWFRVGDNQIKTDRYGRNFDFGHICGSFDSSEEGVWELFLSTHDSPDGSTLAPGVTFASAGHRWEGLGRKSLHLLGKTTLAPSKQHLARAPYCR